MPAVHVATPAAPATETRAGATARRRQAPSQGAQALLAALALRQQTADPASEPNARLTRALDTLASAGTTEGLQANQPKMKAVCRDLFNWHDPKQVKATAAVRLAVDAGLYGTDAKGRSTYSVTVEGISFAAACVPLLAPERLLTLLEHTTRTANSAFGPIKYTARTAAPLRRLLARYTEDRRLELLMSLWDAAHSGRWWEATMRNPRRPRMTKEARAALEEQQHEIDRLLAEGALRGQAHGSYLADALESGSLTYSLPAVQFLRDLPATGQDRQALAALKDHRDADVRVLLSNLAWTTPVERPESPIAELVQLLVHALDDSVADLDEKPKDTAQLLPEKPTSWSELYPAPDQKRYPLPAQITDLTGQEVPGAADSLLEVILNQAALRANGDDMHNCTLTRHSRCREGNGVVLKVAYQGQAYNAELVRDRAGAPWRLGEVNSRYNRGNVPAEIRTGLQQIARGLPA